ncbi:MAG: DUF1365 domain-containing protein [Acidimicrobiia bacterium]
MTSSAIYDSVVKHRRFQPMGHELKYGVWSMLVDLDELPQLAKDIPVFSHNRWNLVSFHNRDHGGRDGGDLRSWFEGHLRTADVDLEGGSIQMLVFPRILGYTFNPITVWFGYHRDGDLRAVMYEVHNTFGHGHSHLAILPPGSTDLVPKHRFQKTLHVSPFFDQIGSYRVSIAPPDDTYSIVIEYLDEDESRLLTASQRGERVELSTGSLLKQFFTSPLLTLKVVAGIHWEAIKLLRKGAKYRPVPESPDTEIEVTHVGEDWRHQAAA